MACENVVNHFSALGGDENHLANDQKGSVFRTVLDFVNHHN